MRIPAALAALIVTLIGGAVAIAGEVSMAHPLHQAIVIVAAFLTGVIGLFTTAPASSSSERAPPFDIPAALPTPASSPTSTASSRPEIPHPPAQAGIG